MTGHGFFQDSGGTYKTETRNILQAARFFRLNPDGEIVTGMWEHPTWDKHEFREWFIECLNAKCSRGLEHPAWRRWKREYQRNQEVDGETILAFTAFRRRSSGSCGMLRTPELKRRFPHINCQPWED